MRKIVKNSLVLTIVLLYSFKKISEKNKDILMKCVKILFSLYGFVAYFL